MTPLLDDLVKIGGVFLAGVLCDIQHLRFDGSGAQLNFQHIPYFDIIGGAGNLPVYEHLSGVAGFIGYRAAFDDA